MLRHINLLFVAFNLLVTINIVHPQVAFAQSQTIVCVDADSNNTSAPSGSNPGDGWGNTAYKHLQQGLTRASQLLLSVPDVQVWVANGTYYPDDGDPTSPSDPRDSTFRMKNNVGIYGGFVGNEPLTVAGFRSRNPVTNIAMLSGDLQQNDNPSTPSTFDDNAYHVVTGELLLPTDRDRRLHHHRRQRAAGRQHYGSGSCLFGNELPRHRRERGRAERWIAGGRPALTRVAVCAKAMRERNFKEGLAFSPAGDILELLGWVISTGQATCEVPMNRTAGQSNDSGTRGRSPHAYDECHSTSLVHSRPNVGKLSQESDRCHART
jgi:hypothetical protein